ncbi:short chain dehydrogenase [Plectosphaerella cucumerina]|uniref:Short chain dehydrogenase n=1 Tax=Plectosphaerella cucumerina TaxID=40658 RepID=A0A8K0TLN5_9PEZI|nr:short chain dehydrogenase [Plectosphaerella cucumerina]
MPTPATTSKTALITGCTPGGIGYELAREFHAKGYHVIATARRPELLGELKEQGMTTLELDVTKSQSIEACRNSVADLTGGRLDILVNNAGKRYTIPATDIDLDEVRATYETNVFGVMATVQAFAPLLIATRGTIVMISSLSAVSPYIFRSIYASSKGALNAYSRTLRQELRPFGVRVIVSMTGTVKSEGSNYPWVLPADSIYQRIQDIFYKTVRFSQQNGTMDTQTFARTLVAEVIRGNGWFGGLLGGARNWFWAGGLSTQIWLARFFFGEWLLDQITYRRFELNKLEAIVKKENANKTA